MKLLPTNEDVVRELDRITKDNKEAKKWLDILYKRVSKMEETIEHQAYQLDKLRNDVRNFNQQINGDYDV